MSDEKTTLDEKDLKEVFGGASAMGNNTCSKGPGRWCNRCSYIEYYQKCRIYKFLQLHGPQPDSFWESCK